MEQQLVIKRPIRGSFPTREYIRDCMATKFAGARELLMPVASICAEEAERIFLNYWRVKGNGTIVVEKMVEKLVVAETHEVTIEKGCYSESARRLCPNCKEKRITQRFKYCPICGSAIKWK